MTDMPSGNHFYFPTDMSKEEREIRVALYNLNRDCTDHWWKCTNIELGRCCIHRGISVEEACNVCIMAKTETIDKDTLNSEYLPTLWWERESSDYYVFPGIIRGIAEILKKQEIKEWWSDDPRMVRFVYLYGTELVLVEESGYDSEHPMRYKGLTGWREYRTGHHFRVDVKWEKR